MLAEFKDYVDLHAYAAQALQIDRNNMCALYWMIVAAHRQGAIGMAETLLKEAERNLSSNEYEELKRNLKKKDGLPWFHREHSAQHK